MKVFQQPHYTESFIQSILSAIQPQSTLVIGGDGRYFNKDVVRIIIAMSAANGVSKLIIGKGGILSTPGKEYKK